MNLQEIAAREYQALRYYYHGYFSQPSTAELALRLRLVRNPLTYEEESQRKNGWTPPVAPEDTAAATDFVASLPIEVRGIIAIADGLPASELRALADECVLASVQADGLRQGVLGQVAARLRDWAAALNAEQKAAK